MKKMVIGDMYGEQAGAGLAALAGAALAWAGGRMYMNDPGRNRAGSFNPSTGDNTGMVPWNLLGRQRDRDSEDLPRNIPDRRGQRPRSPGDQSPSESSSSSSSSDDEDIPKFGNGLSSVPLMNNPNRRLIEINIPVYCNYDVTGSFSVYSLGTNTSDFTACIPLLLNLNTVPTPPSYLYGTSYEFINMSKCYRNVKIDSIFLTFYYDVCNNNIFRNLPELSMNISADQPLKYVSPNNVQEWYYDNYNNDSNIYFQTYSRRHSTLMQNISIPDHNIETSNGSVNGWIDCSNISKNTLSLNIGYTGSKPIKAPAATVVQRIGIIAVVLDCQFANQQTSLGF